MSSVGKMDAMNGGRSQGRGRFLSPDISASPRESYAPSKKRWGSSPKNGNETGMRTYNATVTRDGNWWMIEIPEIGYTTQAPSLAEVEEMARSLVSGATETSPDSFELDVNFDLGDLDQAVKMFMQARERENAAREELDRAASSRRKAAGDLRSRGLSVADAASLLGVTPSRVYQLTSAE